MMIMMTIEDIKKLAYMDMVEYSDGADRKRKGMDQYYINFKLDDGGYGSFNENQNNGNDVEVYYE